MKRFAQLYAELDASTATTTKLAALQRYLADAPLADAAWAVHLLCGAKPRQLMPTRELRALAMEQAGVSEWLFEESYQAVGDLAETTALLLPPPQGDDDTGLADWMQQRLLPLRGLSAEQRRANLAAWWDTLDTQRRFLLTKLMSGGFRVGVSRMLVQRALAAHAGLDAKLVAERMMGTLDGQQQPSAQGLQAVLAPAAAAGEADASSAAQFGVQPYPFFLAHPLPEADLSQTLGAPQDWLAEWKFDGIRAQAVLAVQPTQPTQPTLWLWSRGEELITDRFPELQTALSTWPAGTVLDGEVLVWHPQADHPAPFAELQRRIGRKTLTKRMLAEHPAVFLAYDLLRCDGQDWRAKPLLSRRERLQTLVAQHGGVRLSPALQADTWEGLAEQRALARERGVEGLMLKSLVGAYGAGRTRGEGLWWKWKLEPLTVDGVLIHAQAGHGRRASVYTDYTFAVWNRPPKDAAEAQACVQAIAAGEKPPSDPAALQLVPFAKAYSGLTDAEFKAVDAVIRRDTVNKFGPVRAVRPSLVFEIGFEGINRSGRHRSGVALRFPRMLRIRHDKPLHQANVLGDLQALLPPGAATMAGP